MTSCLDLTSRLIAQASLTPDDAGCQQLLAERLAAAGFAIHHLRFAETDNLWAVHGASGPTLALVGHTDVVPPGPLEAWHSPPFEPAVRDGRLYGRGAADMKSGVAALALAAERFVSKHPTHPGRLAYVMTSDEEGPAKHGIVKVMEWLAERGERIDYALIGEPSSSARFGDRVRHGRRGSLHGYLKILGVQGHVAYPEKALNPIHRFAPAMQELVGYEFDRGNAHFPPTSFVIYEIAAGAGANNVIPGELLVKCNWRFGTASSAESIQQQVRGVLDRHALRYEFSTRVASAPFLTGAGLLLDAVEQAVFERTGERPLRDTGGGTSDGRYIAPTGAQVVELGPVNESIHKVNEWVDVADLEPMVEIYEAIIARMLLP